MSLFLQLSKNIPSCPLRCIVLFVMVENCEVLRKMPNHPFARMVLLVMVTLFDIISMPASAMVASPLFCMVKPVIVTWFAVMVSTSSVWFPSMMVVVWCSPVRMSCFEMEICS